MQNLNTWMFALEATTTFAIVVTLVLYLIELREMRRQIRQAQRGNVGATTLRLIEFLQSSDARSARTLAADVEGFELGEWSDRERNAMKSVLSHYDVAGMLVRYGMVDRDVIVDNWGASLRYFHEIGKPLLHELRERAGTDYYYWDDFEWLAKQGVFTPPIH